MTRALRLASPERAPRWGRSAAWDPPRVALDTRADGKTAFEFMINAAGVLADGVYSNDTEYSRDWDAVWDGRAHSALGEPRTIDQAALRAEPAAIETEPNYETGTFNVNIVMRWEYRLGSTLFVVYTHRQTDEITPSGGARAGLRFPLIKPRAASDILLVKLSYWWG